MNLNRTFTLLAWALRRDLRPKPAWSYFRQRLLELSGSVLMIVGGLILLPLTLILLCLEPLMLFIRPFWWALFRPASLEKAITMLEINSAIQNPKPKDNN